MNVFSPQANTTSHKGMSSTVHRSTEWQYILFRLFFFFGLYHARFREKIFLDIYVTVLHCYTVVWLRNGRDQVTSILHRRRTSTRCYTVLQGVTQCYTMLHVLQGVTRCYTLLQAVTQCYTVLHGVTRCYRLLHNVTRCYRLLHGVTGCYTMLHGVTGCSSMALQKAKKFTIIIEGQLYCK